MANSYTVYTTKMREAHLDIMLHAVYRTCISFLTESLLYSTGGTMAKKKDKKKDKKKSCKKKECKKDKCKPKDVKKGKKKDKKKDKKKKKK